MVHQTSVARNGNPAESSNPHRYSFNLDVPYVGLHCQHCSIAFAIPDALRRIRMADGRHVNCPGCGRRNYFVQRTDPLAEERKAIADERLRLVHQREQAEAAAAEGGEQ